MLCSHNFGMFSTCTITAFVAVFAMTAIAMVTVAGYLLVNFFSWAFVSNAYLLLYLLTDS